MKKVLVLFLTAVFVLSLAGSVFAQNQTSEFYYQELMAKYRTYQNSVEPYNTAKAKFLAYQSVISQADYLEAAKKLLTVENSAILSYANTVKTRLAEATSVLNYQENLYYIKLDDEITAFTLMANKIGELSTLDDLKTFWETTQSRFKVVASYGYQTKAYIEIGAFTKVFENVKVTKEKMTAFLQDNPINSPEAKAAKDKFNGLGKNFSEIEIVLNQAKAIQKGASTNNLFKSESEHIHELLIEATAKSESLLTEYDRIITTLIGQ